MASKNPKEISREIRRMKDEITETKDADAIFKNFKEHSIAEFFKKNRQMLGYSGKVRSLVTVVHEYVTNSLDASEEAGILPDITVEIKELGEDKYSVTVEDNGPGIPKTYIGKALATVLAGTKFNRYMQQRGQQGIGAAGCTMFSQMRYTKQLSMDLSNLTGKDEKKIEERVSALVAKHYPKVKMGDDGELFDDVPEAAAAEESSDSKAEGSDEEEEG